MRLNPRFCALALAALLPLAQAIPDANGVIVPIDAPNLADDAAMSARLNYNMGFERFEQATQQELHTAAKAGTPADVLRGFTEAREKFRKAAAADPTMKEAWNMVGYTSRRLGDYAESLSAYETALKLQPDYPEATEYLAELYVLTGRLDDAKASFTKLLKLSPSYANVLLESMRKWLAGPGKSASVVGVTQRDAFATWVKAQKVVL
jgi:protein O-GlcNAc transferase